MPHDYPDDYDLDTSDGMIVEDGSTIGIFLLVFFAIGIFGGVAKLAGLMS